MKFAGKWMKFKKFILSEVTELKENTVYICLYVAVI